MQVKLHVEQLADKRRYNLPTEEEIAVVVPEDKSEDVRRDWDIIVWLIGGSLQRISHCIQATPVCIMFCYFHMMKMDGVMQFLFIQDHQEESDLQMSAKDAIMPIVFI